jgi:chemotaxis methyl-accepting protein methylase
VRSYFGREYIIDISDIRNLINITETQKYKVGDKVAAVVDFHWKDVMKQWFQDKFNLPVNYITH